MYRTDDTFTNDSAEHFNRQMRRLGKADACAERYKPTDYELFESELEYHYRSSFVVQQLCDFLPSAATHTFKGWSMAKGTKAHKKLLKKAYAWYQRSVLAEHVDGGSLGRLSGDCYLLAFLSDGVEPDQPINYDGLTDIRGFLALPDYAVSFDHVSYETSTTATVASNYEHRELINSNYRTYHVDRFIRIPGKRLASALRDNRRSYRNQSVLETFLPAFDGWLNANVGIIQMLESHSTFVLGMKNLAFKTKTKDEESLAGRFSMLMSGIKNIKGLIHDADNETASFISRSYTNIDKVLRSLDTFVASSCDVPLPFLFDGSEAYTSSSRGAREALALSVQSYQKTHLRPALERLMWLWLHTQMSAVEVEKIFDEIDIDFGDGLILTREEEANLRFKTTQTHMLLTGGAAVLHPQEVRSHWRGGLWHDELIVDSDGPPPNMTEQPLGNKEGATKSPLINTLTSKEGRSPHNGQEIQEEEEEEEA